MSIRLEEAFDLWKLLPAEDRKGAEIEEKEAKPWRGQEKSRAWFMTLNNPVVKDWERLMADDFVCFEGQVEKSASGTLHIQAVIYYKTPRVKPVKKHPRAWLRPLISAEGASNYVTKEATRVIGPILQGAKPQQGARTDLQGIADAMAGGATEEEIARENPVMYMKFHRGIAQLSSWGFKDRTVKPTVYWLWGGTGVGKTRFAMDVWGPANVYVKDGTRWWDGYTQQRCVLIDDFDGKWEFRDFLRVLDRYKYQVQKKGCYIRFNSPFIVITCEYHPNMLYHGTQLGQVLRRIDSVLEVTPGMDVWKALGEGAPEENKESE